MMRPAMSKQHALHNGRVFLDVNTVGDTTIIPGVPSAFPQESLCTAVSHGLLG
jgi:hypothetical protein